jgi:thiamine-monophosphate kinase
MREFDLIARHFAPLAGAEGLGLADDAALLVPPAGRHLVVSADALVQGVHFLAEDPPDLVARKLLRVNLSDLAAMGATPAWYLLTLSVPQVTPDAWFAAFAAGLAADQVQYGLSLAGGDTTSTPGPVSLSATVIGHVAPGQALRRGGAAPGHGLWVTGTIGDAALGLLAAQGRLADPGGFLAGRYRLPQPRLGLTLHGIAAAATDISDGLLQDIGHICTVSGVGAVIDIPRVPISLQARAAGPDWLECCLTGGDDYELALAVPPDREAALSAVCAAGGVPITRIGAFVHGSGVRACHADGRAFTPARPGWSHF